MIKLLKSFNISHKGLFKALMFFVPIVAYACPMCAGSDTGKDRHTVAILASFIALTYIPYYVIFKLFRKYKDVNKEIHDSSTPTSDT